MSYSFINPYNFVPLGKPVREKKWEQTSPDRLLTGKIEYTLTTLTPLFIPNTSNDRIFSVSDPALAGSTPDEPKYHKSFEFFSYQDLSGKRDMDQESAEYQPVIPGSEIRGAVRSTYEALTDSCLSALDLDAVLTKRMPERFSQGILKWHDDQWLLYKADDYLYRQNYRDDFSVKTFKTLSSIHDGEKVLFCKDTVHAPRRPYRAKPLADKVRCAPGTKGIILKGTLTGYLVKGESGPKLGKPSSNPKCNDCPDKTKKLCASEGYKECYLIEKHCAHIFRENGTPIACFDSVQRDFYTKQIDNILRLYKNNKVSPYTEYTTTWKSFLRHDKNGIPVYYSKISETQYYFSPACVTREMYINSIREIVGNYSPCGSTGRVCPACSLFGTINDGLHITSRIRFSDLTVDEKSVSSGIIFDKIVTLPELSSPKISATEFYLEKPDVENIMNWTYDYYITMGDDKKPKLVTYTPVISGRKFYWHSRTALQLVFQGQTTIEQNERNKTVRPVTAHVPFKGTLYFDGISEKELRELIAIMNISAFADDNRYAIKLGAAKPLGFGSVALKVDSVNIRTLRKEDRKILYKPDEPYSFGPYDLSLFERDDIIKAFDTQALQSLEKDGYSVAYPRVEQGGDIYSWFGENRFAGRFDKKTSTVSLRPRDKDSGPGLRIQVAYNQYMKAMEPKLSYNTLLSPSERKTTDHNIKPAAPKKVEGKSYSGTSQHTYSIGDTLTGIVTRYSTNQKGDLVYAWVDTEHQQIKVHISNIEPRPDRKKNVDIKTILPLDTPVQVRKKGKNNYGDVWTCITSQP